MPSVLSQREDQRSIALWAADCAEHVLPYFEEQHPADDRPRKAIEAGRAWARAEITCGVARAAALAAHAAARDAAARDAGHAFGSSTSGADPHPAIAAARAAGHAAVTAHMVGHARAAAEYALKAVAAAATSKEVINFNTHDAVENAVAVEREWQYKKLPEHVRKVVFIPSVDEYVALFPEDKQEILKEMREIIRAAAPEATEKISYQMPTFYQEGNLVHFAAWKNHIGFYPGSSATRAFKAELSELQNAKGTIRFPLDKPLPTELITKIVKFRVAENLEKAERRSRKRKGS